MTAQVPGGAQARPLPGGAPARPQPTQAWVDRHIGLAMAGLAAFVAAAVMLGLQVWPVAAVAAGASAPYTDSQATGYLTLYNKAGKAIKSGSIKDKPFVWKAVSSQKAKAPYDGKGRKATLIAFQPRQGTQPATWSSDTLTASTGYSDPGHPAAQGTAEDFSLKDFLDSFPPQWAGMVQLRLILSAPGAQAQSTGYASTDLKITGDRWTVVGGGPGAGPGGVNIAGKADPTTPAASASAAPGGSVGPSSPVAPGTSGEPAAGDGGGTGAGLDTDVLADLPYMRAPGYLLVASAVLVALVFAGLLLRRRRQYAPGEW